MVTEHPFDLRKPEFSGPIEELNELVAGLKIERPLQAEDANDLYGANVFGIRFSGNTALAIGVDAVSNAFWPTDLEATAQETAQSRDYLLVCANYPDIGRTNALQYFATFKPSTSPWIKDEDEVSELGKVANYAVNIDSSVKLKDKSYDELPPRYLGPVSAYPMNLFWLTQIMDYKMAIIEINSQMRASLATSGLELGEIAEAIPRIIDGTSYERFVIDPSTGSNGTLVDYIRDVPPTTFHLRDDGLVIPDDNTVKA